MHTRIESATTVLLVVAALVVAGATAHREFGGSAQGRAAGTAPPPEFVANWKDLVPTGVLVGDSAAPIKIIEFGDLECPACKTFHSTLRDLAREHRKDVALIFVHYPLQMHRFARPAARAAECARDQGRFAQYYDLTYDKQYSLGIKPWTSYAAEAGVADTALFLRCVHKSTPVPSVEAGVALGTRIGVHATPTVLVNGWRFGSTPSGPDLAKTVVTLLEGKQPFAAKNSHAGT